MKRDIQGNQTSCWTSFQFGTAAPLPIFILIVAFSSRPIYARNFKPTVGRVKALSPRHGCEPVTPPNPRVCWAPNRLITLHQVDATEASLLPPWYSLVLCLPQLSSWTMLAHDHKEHYSGHHTGLVRERGVRAYNEMGADRQVMCISLLFTHPTRGSFVDESPLPVSWPLLYEEPLAYHRCIELAHVFRGPFAHGLLYQ